MTLLITMRITSIYPEPILSQHKVKCCTYVITVNPHNNACQMKIVIKYYCEKEKFSWRHLMSSRSLGWFLWFRLNTIQKGWFRTPWTFLIMNQLKTGKENYIRRYCKVSLFFPKPSLAHSKGRKIQALLTPRTY